MELISIRMDDYISHIVSGEPVTLSFTMLTDGTPPPVGSRLQFRARDGAAFLHASMPSSGAQMSYSEDLKISTLTITEDQLEGWNPRRTLTFTTPVNMDSSKISEIFGIVYYQPSYEEGYFPVLVQPDGKQAISTRQVFAAKWQDTVTGGWIYSYDVMVKACDQSIAQWKFSSAGLPTGTSIYANPWLDVVHDAKEGIVELATPPGDRYVLIPGKEVAVSIQLLYPAAKGQSPAFESLPNLTAVPR
ncbi:hypothetical protein [Pseudomonas atacamensis]|jgi:hypothetical protein|uniref:hypothetical protein n=1 Tax=Pseudomonas atacamensis TaxID=2565368 RepID=UPI0019D31E4D|nr:hypothetical protein [Pseudomonas atacamensis]QSL86980.1 hypothetical protein JWU58_22820 [Pseudomonas atacamensis]